MILRGTIHMDELRLLSAIENSKCVDVAVAGKVSLRYLSRAEPMKKPAIALCCAYVCLFSLSAGRSQENDRSPAPKLSKAPNADLSKEAIVYEKVRGHLRYDADGTGSNDTYARIRVQSYAGVQRVGQLIFNYDSANSKIEVVW